MYGEVLYSESSVIDRIRNLINSVKDALNKAGKFSTQTSTVLDRGIAVVCPVILKHAIEFFREFQDV